MSVVRDSLGGVHVLLNGGTLRNGIRRYVNDREMDEKQRKERGILQVGDEL
jgi:hypothetical protein